MVSKGRQSEDYVDISHIREADIAGYYLGVRSIPCLIASPLRQDNKPSFSLFSNDGKEVGFIDYSTREHGSIMDLMMRIWNCSFLEAKRRIANDIGDSVPDVSFEEKKHRARSISIRTSSDIELRCKIRKWERHDIEYWGSYGISVKWLRYADVYPISHKIIIKDGRNYVFGAEKYAYAYVEFKEGKTTLKIYQPLSSRHKWSNRHDRSVISLWTKVPEEGNIICICSSLKDALCLWANTGIPSVAVQGEGYSISDTAANELRKRFRDVCICFDNDSPGLKDAEVLSSKTGFRNVILPPFEGGKDISDLYKCMNDKDKFKTYLLKLLKK